jgi:hypothetical protein
VASCACTRFTGSIAIAASDSRRLYASFAIASWSTNHDAGCLAGMFKSIDSGKTWTVVDVPDYFKDTYAYGVGSDSCQGSYDNALAVDPANENDVYAGGITLIRSKNVGVDNWLPVGLMQDSDSSKNLHPDQHAIKLDRDGNAYVANDGGLFRVGRDGSVTDLSPGLTIAQFYAGGSVSSDDLEILGGTQDNGNIRANTSALAQSASSWQAILSGDGGFTAIDQADPQRQYVEYVYGDLRSTVNGEATQINWEQIGPGASHAAPYMPFVVDPQHWDTIFAGADNVYKTTSGGHWGRTADGQYDPSKSWSKLTDWTGQENVTALAVADNGQTIVAGRDDGLVFASSTGGAPKSWLPYNLEEPILSILIDPNNSQTVYFAVRSADDFKVWRATSFFTTPNWERIDSGLPATNVLRGYLGHILAGTDVGVYTLDQGKWSLIGGNSLPAVPIVDVLAMHNGALVALTHGRGAWILTSHK